MAHRPPPADLGSLTIGQWISALRPSQLWAVLTLLAGLVGAGFGAGYKLRSATAEVQVSGQQQSTRDLGALQTKERFLSLYLRYLIAVTDETGLGDDSASPHIREAADSLKSYIQQLLRRGNEVQNEIDLTGLTLGKPARTDTTARYDATVRFPYDGTVWPVPARFGLAAASR